MNEQTRLFNRAAAVLLGAAIAAWGTWNVVDAVSFEKWRRTTWDGNTVIEPGRNHTTGYLRAAGVALNAVLPPDYATAERMLKQAIRLDPLRSDLWLNLASVQAYQGKREVAGVALRRSDELDPRYPTQRMESIKLWMLLGDVDRAVELARNVGLMDFELRIEMAKTLRMLGKTPAQIFVLLEGQELTNGQMTRFLSSLRSESPARMRELFAEIPATMYQDVENRRAIAELAMRPLVPEVALRIWQLENQSLSVVHAGLENHPPLLADNLQLKRELPEERFVFGWQSLSYSSMSGMNWHSPEEIGASHGALSLVVDHLSQPARDTLRYTFYRLVVPADLTLTVSLQLKAEPAGRSRCHLRVQPLGGDAVESSAADSLKAGWQTLKVDLPAHSESRTVELMLVRAPRGNSISESPTRLYLGELSLEPIPTTAIEVSDGGSAQ